MRSPPTAALALMSARSFSFRSTDSKSALKESYREQLVVTASTQDTGEYPYLYMYCYGGTSVHI
eukprot:SAG11_NODE_146_length_14788_cov_5.672884_8_plen_64_part_00